MLARRCRQLWRQVGGVAVETFGVRAEGCGFAADGELDGVGAAVEETGEASDERLLLGGVSHFEARPTRLDKQNVRVVCELDKSVLEDPPHGQIERHKRRAGRRS